MTSENLLDFIRISGINLTSKFSLVVKAQNSTTVTESWIQGSNFSVTVLLPIHFISIMTAKLGVSFTNLFLSFTKYSMILVITLNETVFIRTTLDPGLIPYFPGG